IAVRSTFPTGTSDTSASSSAGSAKTSAASTAVSAYTRAMAEPLTAEQIQILKRRLLKKGAEVNEKLTQLLNGQRRDLEALTGPRKPGETPIERLRRFLALVDGRIQAIRAGRPYGRCEKCDAPLPFAHLEQVPWIDTCEACAG